MKSITWSISSMVFGMVSLFTSCSQPTPDPLMELLLDYQSRNPTDPTFTFPCFDENSTDSTFITLFFNSGFEQEDGGKIISIHCLSPYLEVGHFGPMRPSPPSIKDCNGGQNVVHMDSLWQEYEKKYLEWKYWHHLCDRLGHPYGITLRGMISEGRLKVLVYGLPEDVAPFVAQHKLQYDAALFRYMNYKDKELYGCGWNIDPIILQYQLTDTLGHFVYKGIQGRY